MNMNILLWTILTLLTLYFYLVILTPSDTPTLLVFVSKTCPHCQACKGEIEAYRRSNPCRVVDVSDESDVQGLELARQVELAGVPSFYFQTVSREIIAIDAAAPRTKSTWLALRQEIQ